MKKTILLVMSWLFFAAMANAQTWTGTIGTDWNTPGNWNPATVPTSGSNVYVPGSGITNWPKFASAVIINNLNMDAGSRIDVNGFAFTINGQSSVYGATFNNSNVAADIVLNTGGSGQHLFGGNTFNDAVIFTYASTGTLYESYGGTDHFTSSLTLVITSDAEIHFANGGATVIDGNITINRTVAGTSYLFEQGAVISGNLSFANNAGGNSYVGGNTQTRINGTVNLAANFSSTSPAYVISFLKNQTTGGTVNIQNAGYVRLLQDSLKLNVASFTGFKNSTVNDFTGNEILLNTLTISDDAATANTIYLRNSHITGNTIVNFNGSGDIYESYGGPNIFTGNVTYNIAGTGTLHHNYDYQPTGIIMGNFSVNRTGIGTTELFRNGGTVGGNFSYVNNVSGSTSIGNPSFRTMINGTVTLTSDFGTTNVHSYNVGRIINQTAGGSINIQHPNYIVFNNDTLKASPISITNIRNGTTTDFNSNDLTGNLTVSDDPATGSYFYFRGNKVTGTTVINRNGNQDMYEAYSGANLYVGNTTYNLAGSGTLYSSYSNHVIYQGNLTVNKTVASTTNLFGSNGATITGNFIFNSSAGGTTNIGNSNADASPVNIAGTVNITSNGPAGTHATNIEHVINQTTGGSINITNASYVRLSIDTLKLATATFTGIKNGTTSDIRGNQLDAVFSFSDDATDGAYLYVRGNTFLNDVTLNRNGPQEMYESYSGANRYLGNFTLNQNGNSQIYLSYSDSAVFAKDVTFNVNSNLHFNNRVRFSGASNGTLKQTGAAPITIAAVEMMKTGTGKLILNTPLTISNTLMFNGGNIQSNAANPLNFTNDATHTGLSVASHVTGPVSKTGDDAFTFPIGNDASLDTVSMTAPALNTDKFTAQYFYGNATANGYDTAQRAANLKRVSGCEYWDVKRDAGSSNVSLTFGYSGLCTTGGYYITDPTKISVAHWTGALWEDLGNGGASGIPNGAIKTATAVSNFSPFAIASTDLTANLLPLKLISFTGVKQNDKVMLQWLTENETTLASFDVEKSLDGVRFQRIATLNALNNTGRNNYRNVDNEPAKGYNFYRLKQTDINGKFSYSNVVKVDFSDNAPICISPNPATSTVIVTDAKIGDIARIINSLGQVVAALKITANNKQLDVSKLDAGIYMLQLISDKTTRVAQFVKQ